MEFLNNIGNAISSGIQSLGNWISNTFMGGGGYSAPMSGPSYPQAQPGVVVGAAAQPPYAPAAAPLYPQAVTNIHNVGSVQNQLGSAARQLTNSLGWTGAGSGPLGHIVDGAMRTTDMTMRQDAKIAAAQQREAMFQANSNGAISMAPYGATPGVPVNMRGAFAANSGSYSERLIQARHDGAQAMMNRSVGAALTDVGQRVVRGWGQSPFTRR